MHDETTPVLIVGGGLVGLSMALFLGQNGVRPLLVERHYGTAIHARTPVGMRNTTRVNIPTIASSASRASSR